MGAGLEALAAQRGARGRFAWLRAMSPYVEFLLALVAASVFYAQGSAAWPLALLGLSRLLSLARTGFRWRVSPFGIPLWLFLASAGLGVWTAYDRGAAWAVFYLLVGGVGLYYAIADQPDSQHLYGVLAFWGLFGLVFSLYFLGGSDWVIQESKVPLLAALGQSIQRWLPKLPGSPVNPNTAGGTLATMMPLYVPLIAMSYRRAAMSSRPWARFWPLLWSLVAGGAGLGWLLSTSRGAWAALVGMVVLWAIWHVMGRWSRRVARGEPGRAWRTRLWGMAALALGGAVFLAVFLALILSARLPGAGALTNRLSIYRDALLLARDYRWIGAGLGTFPMQFSIYTLLIHVGYITYGHNVFLSILIAQGLFGLLAYLGLLAAALIFSLRQLRRLDGLTTGQAWVIEAGLASQGVLLAHGLVDDVFYTGAGALLLFVPLAIILAASRGAGAPSEPARIAVRRWPVVVAGIALLALGIIGRQALLGAWYANLGALAQARVELNAYDQWHFGDLTMDQVRQREDLSLAIRWLTRALQADPTNPTARQRLAAIDLSRGQYEQALEHMRAAWDAGYRDSVTRLLYGDALVAAGQPERAAEVIRGLARAETRLLLQAWARYWAARDYRRAANAWATVVLLNPDNKDAADSRAEAEKLLGKAQ